MENETTDLEQSQNEETTEEVVEETPNTEEVDYKELYESERRERNKLKNKLYSKEEPEPRKGINNRSSEDKWKQKIELSVKGYNEEEIGFVLKNGGVKALEDPFVSSAIEGMREKRKAEAATLDNEGQKSTMKSGLSKESFAKLSAEDQLKALQNLN